MRLHLRKIFFSYHSLCSLISGNFYFLSREVQVSVFVCVCVCMCTHVRIFVSVCGYMRRCVCYCVCTDVCMMCVSIIYVKWLCVCSCVCVNVCSLAVVSVLGG